ncbi:MAG TPA: kelch repeat-containing protein [Chloroflexia bacterium]|nr:kelch repeat-containing protein [Chloroflexia bacterium]
MLTLVLAVALLSSAIPPAGTTAQPETVGRLFPETGKTVSGRFLDYWNTHGGLLQQGYPISEEMQERSDTDGKTYTVQYFERAVFEHHPENAPPYDVLLSLLGVFRYDARYPEGAPNQRPNRTNGRHFSDTGRWLGGRFRDYWESNGGLAQQGYPISDEFQEKSDLDGKTYTVQYFERAVFEHHPENAPPYDVLLSQLGTFRFRERYARAAVEPVSRIEPTSSMAVERSCHSSTLLPNGKVLIAGGMIREGNYTPTAELYGPSTGTFAPTGSMSVGRACHSATLLPNGKVLIAAGSYGGTLDSAELYDPATGKFTPTGSMSAQRDGFTATLLDNGKVLIAGGSRGDMMLSAELYDPATGKFTPTGSMTEPRAIHTASLLPDGTVLIAGGGSDGSVLQTAELYDPATGTFSPTGTMTIARYKHAAVSLPDGRVVIVGGSNNLDWRGRYTSTEIYDPHTGVFSPAGDMSTARFKLGSALALLPGGTLLIAGGGDRAEVYNPATNTFATADGTMDTPRFAQAATTLPDGTVLITGGYDTAIRSTSTAWLYGQ